MDASRHWESIYKIKPETEVSWFQAHSTVSLELIQHTGILKADPIIDVGAGTSRLVDDLLAEEFQDLTVLDISAAALQTDRERLGTKAALIHWIQADVTEVSLPYQHFAVWHDRAVFHFLLDEPSRQKYVEKVRHSVRPGGHVIVATFGVDGPLRCSGLDVMRYSPDRLHQEFGNAFTLVEHTDETHQTPFGTAQQFIYCYCRKA